VRPIRAPVGAPPICPSQRRASDALGAGPAGERRPHGDLGCPAQPRPGGPVAWSQIGKAGARTPRPRRGRGPRTARLSAADQCLELTVSTSVALADGALPPSPL
jgi:hypothetical protein